MNRGVFHGRALTALLMAIGFFIVSFSGVVLFVAPNGRVAGQINWHILALDRREWSDLHIVFGFIFIAVGFFHLWFNRKPLLSYLKQRMETKGSCTMRWEPLVALLLSVALVYGTVKQIAPVSFIEAWRETLRQSQYGSGQ